MQKPTWGGDGEMLEATETVGEYELVAYGTIDQLIVVLYKSSTVSVDTTWDVTRTLVPTVDAIYVVDENDGDKFIVAVTCVTTCFPHVSVAEEGVIKVPALGVDVTDEITCRVDKTVLAAVIVPTSTVVAVLLGPALEVPLANVVELMMTNAKEEVGDDGISSYTRHNPGNWGVEALNALLPRKHCPIDFS